MTTLASTLPKMLTVTLVAAALGAGLAGSAHARSPFSGSAGDFNGDGTADVVSFTRGQSADVYVALSDGSRSGVRSKWHDLFATAAAIPLVGDFTGDGLDDVASFSRGVYGQVHVAASTGSKFVNTGGPWVSDLALGDAIPQVGDFNGDGRTDIAAVTRDEKVWIAYSTGSSFAAAKMQGGW